MNSCRTKEKLILSKNANFIYRGANVVAFNKTRGHWIRFSKECYEYMMQAVNTRMSIEDFLGCFEENDDRKYIHQLLLNLKNIDVLVTRENRRLEEIYKLKSVSWMITERCNLSCKHCGASAIGQNNEEIFNTKELKIIVDKVMACRPESITLTGGEPLVREDLIDIIEYIKSKEEVKVILMTNATLITPRIASFFSKNIEAIDISIDGYNEETCSYIRGEGVFDKVIKNIELLKKSGNKKISLSMVSVHSNNYEEFLFSELCKRLEVTPIIRRLSLVGRAKTNSEYLYLKREPKEVDYKFKPPNPSYEDLKKTVKACSCHAGRSSISIKANGDIVPCSTLSATDMKIGNIQKIKDLYKFFNSKEFRESQGMKKFMENNPYGNVLCNTCDVRHFCFTCPHVAIDYKKNREQFNDYCKKRKRYFYDIIWGEIIG
ncbi:radical SAM protein [Clostridiaceae bacterium M8S5]|nr:radical SAM protein [Clostridiaceae bacterium M8S5]